MKDLNTHPIKHFVVHGLVQGVCFRVSALDKGQSLGLAGWVRNRPDGCVEVMASGREDALQDFADWLHQGPPAAQVKAVEETVVSANELNEVLPLTFEIRR